MQARHLLRWREVAGLSLTTELCWLPSWVLWAVYGVVISAGPFALTHGVGALASVVIVTVLLMQLRRARLLTGAGLVGASATAVVGTVASLLAWKLLGIEAMAVTIAVFDGVSLGPALLASMRSSSLAGVSLSAWATRIVLAIGGIAYALYIGHPAAGGWHYIALPASIFLVCRILWWRRSQAYRAAQAVVLPVPRSETAASTALDTPALDTPALDTPAPEPTALEREVAREMIELEAELEVLEVIEEAAAELDRT